MKNIVFNKIFFVALIGVILCVFGTKLYATGMDGELGDNQKEVTSMDSQDKGVGLIAAALATGLACIGAGIAVAVVASSAVGAISENPKLLGKTIIFAGLAEGIAIYGLIIAIMILNKV